MRPCDVKRAKDIENLRTEAVETPSGWLMVDADLGEVCIHNQLNGEPSTGSVTFKRPEFIRMVRWYLTEQKPKRRKVKRTCRKAVPRSSPTQREGERAGPRSPHPRDGEAVCAGGGGAMSKQDADAAWVEIEAMVERLKTKGIRPSQTALQLIGMAVRMFEKDYPFMAYSIDALMRGFKDISIERHRALQAKDTEGL